MWIKRSEIDELVRRVERLEKKAESAADISKDLYIKPAPRGLFSWQFDDRKAPVAKVVEKILAHLGLEVRLGVDNSSTVTLEKPVDYWANYHPPVAPATAKKTKRK